jgi:hypothetical protein
MTKARETIENNPANEEMSTEELILREYAPRTNTQLRIDLLANIVIIEPLPIGASYLDVR